MMQPGMYSARVNEVRHGHLVNPAQALVIWMGNDLADEFIINRNKAVNWVVDDLVKPHV